MLPNGFIDLHSHLLPGIDDGCASIDQSLACIEGLVAAGFVGSVCSPHVCVDCCSHNTPASIEVAVRELQREVDAAGLDYRLWSGAEVRLAPTTVEWFETHGVPTLGEGRYVLVDFWGGGWPDYCDAAIDYLQRNGYQPLLAHPARMSTEDDQLSAILVRLRVRGVKLQGNLRCLVGGEDGKLAKQRINRLLGEKHYFAVATDVHSPSCLPERLAGVELLRRDFGDAMLQTLLGDNPRAIVSAEAALAAV